mmetsp:Transcript_31539/g.47265  ORF Transcript_31539/g.47265 Transcript_31539/m.47265 type:complete len:306 (+) Transcript_31539:48-965(+)
MKVAPSHCGSPISFAASMKNDGSCHAMVNSRRKFLSSVLTIAATTTTTQFAPANTHLFPNAMIANAAETVGKDPNCNDASCLGVWDGLLADCPHTSNKLTGAGCVSSQDDTPGIFAEPWDYSEVYYDEDSYIKQTDLLILALQTSGKAHGDDVNVELQSGRYLRVAFKDGSTGESSTGEFYFTPNDTTVQFRIGSTAMTSGSLVGRSLSNKERSERIRKALRYTKLPVLRNRKRTWVFVESDDMDGFGPGYNEALGPPAEMSPGERGEERGGDKRRVGETRRLSDDVDPRLKIDFVETFPIRSAR